MKFELKWVYVLSFYIDLPYVKYLPIPLCKCGNAGVVGTRVNYIELSLRKFTIPLNARPVFALPSFAYLHIERAAQSAAAPWRTNWLKGMSGWTEVFFTVNIVAGLLAYPWLWYYDVEHRILFTLAVMIFPLPFDMILFVSAAWVITAALFLLVTYLISIIAPTLIGLL